MTLADRSLNVACDIEDIARALGRSPREVARALQWIGYSGQAYYSPAVWSRVRDLEAAERNVEPVAGGSDAPTFTRVMCGPNNRHEVIEVRPAKRPGLFARLWSRFVAADRRNIAEGGESGEAR